MSLTASLECRKRPGLLGLLKEQSPLKKARGKKRAAPPPEPSGSDASAAKQRDLREVIDSSMRSKEKDSVLEVHTEGFQSLVETLNTTNALLKTLTALVVHLTTVIGQRGALDLRLVSSGKAPAIPDVSRPTTTTIRGVADRAEVAPDEDVEKYKKMIFAVCDDSE